MPNGIAQVLVGVDLKTRPVLERQPVPRIDLRDSTHEQDNTEKRNPEPTPDSPVPRHPPTRRSPAERADRQEFELDSKGIRQRDGQRCPVSFYRNPRRRP